MVNKEARRKLREDVTVDTRTRQTLGDIWFEVVVGGTGIHVTFASRFKRLRGPVVETPPTHTESLTGISRKDTSPSHLCVPGSQGSFSIGKDVCLPLVNRLGVTYGLRDVSFS